MDSDEVERYARGVRNYDFDQFLGPYPVEVCEKWTYLAHYITPSVLEKLEPLNKVIESQSAIEEQRGREAGIKEAQEEDMDESKSFYDQVSTHLLTTIIEGKAKSMSEKAKLRDNLQNIAELMEGIEMDAADEGDFVGHNLSANSQTFYTKIPKQAYPLGATPQEITKHSLDKSYLLTRLLKKDYHNGKWLL